MQAPNDNAVTTFLWAKIGYIALVALIALIAYRVGSVWLGHIILILLTFPMTWFVKPKARRLARFFHLFLSLTLLLATAFILFLTARERADAIAQSKILDFLLGGDAVKALVSIVGSLVVSAIILLGPILVVLYTSTEWILALRETYGVTRGEALRLLISMVFNTSYPYYIVENGEITQTKPKGLLPNLGGPGLVVIKPYNAVVFERGGNISRIEGPGRIITKHMEFAKGVINLRKQWINFTAENVLTQDHVPLTFHCGIGFRIESRKDTAKRVEEQSQSFEGGRFTGVIGGDYPVYRRTVYRAVYNTTAAGWKTLTQGAAETQLRRVLREKYSLENLYRLQDGELIPDKSVIDEIRLEAQGRLHEISITWGTGITGFNIKSFEAPEDVKEKLLEMWAQQYAIRTLLLGAEGSKEAALTKLQADEQITIRIAEAERDAALTKLEADEQVKIRIAGAERDAALAMLLAERQRVISLGDAERLAIAAKASGEGQALLESASAKREAERIQAEGSRETVKIKAEAFIEEARAKSLVEVEHIRAKAEADKDASQITAEGEREATRIRADAIVEEARAKADAAIIEGRGAAEARVELFRRMLALEPSMDRETLWKILAKIQSTEALGTMANWLLHASESRSQGRIERLLPPFLDEDTEE